MNLFEAGDLGSDLSLIASIFKSLGTPDSDIWPVNHSISYISYSPDFGYVLIKNRMLILCWCWCWCWWWKGSEESSRLWQDTVQNVSSSVMGNSSSKRVGDVKKSSSKSGSIQPEKEAACGRDIGTWLLRANTLTTFFYITVKVINAQTNTTTWLDIRVWGNCVATPNCSTYLLLRV